MALKKKLASALSFAHLLGLPNAAAAAEEDEKDKDDESARAEDDDDRKQRDGESDEDYAKRMEEQDEKDKASKAEDESDKPEKDDTDSKKSKRADDDGGDDDSMSSAAGAERARCAAIIAHGIKSGCVRQAGVFAFDTSMSAKQAIAAMDAAAQDGGRRGNSLASRMADVRVPNVGADADAAGGDPGSAEGNAKAMADRIIAAGMKRRNEKA